MDALLAKANNDTSGRQQALKEAMKIAMDDAVYIPLYDLRQLWVTSKDVSGVKFGESGVPALLHGEVIGSGPTIAEEIQAGAYLPPTRPRSWPAPSL